jgi:pimeloyl-ACP methyl ester carboxylesterase
MTGFVDPLLSAGYRAVAYDQPAHGESDGKMTNMLEIAPTMDILVRKEGNFDAVIAHSFGTLITSYSLVRRLPAPSRLVYRLVQPAAGLAPTLSAMTGLPDGLS